MKSAEEILNDYLDGYPWQHRGKENAIKAMEEYLGQFINPVKEDGVLPFNFVMWLTDNDASKINSKFNEWYRMFKSIK